MMPPETTCRIGQPIRSRLTDRSQQATAPVGDRRGTASVDCPRSRPRVTGRTALFANALLGASSEVFLLDPGDAAAENRRHAGGGCWRERGADRAGGALVAGGRVPVLWITGPPGVCKSTVSWQLFTELATSGTRAAFADADQLCICYPALPDDPGRDWIRVRNASAVIGNYRVAGARCVIVNGVVAPAGPDRAGHGAGV